MSTVTRTHQGPLPPAEEFGRYEEVLPGTGDRILGMAERDQGARIVNNNRESRAFAVGYVVSTVGPMLVPIVFLVLCAVLVTQDRDGLAVLAGALAAASAAPGIVVNIRNAFNRNTGDDAPDA